MLFIYSLNMTMSSCLLLALSPINNIVKKFYNVPSTSIEWLSNMSFLGYVVLALPITYMISKWGVRLVIFMSTAANLLATVLHFIGYKGDRFYFVAVGQVFVAFSV